MTATLNLYVNWFAKRFMASAKSGSEFSLPFFSEGDLVPITVKVLQPTEDNPFAFESPDVAALSLTFSVEPEAGGAPFVSQPTWPKDTPNNRFTASVNFGTVGLTSWLASSTSKTALLKIRLGDGNHTTTIIEQVVTIRQNESGANPAAPTPGTRTLTYEEASQVFLKKYADPGDTLTFRTQDGTVGRIFGIYKDGTLVIKQDEEVTI